MTRFRLTFRRDGENDQTEYRYNNEEGEPHIDGRLLVDGETYVIRGLEWIVRRDGDYDDMARFICTLVVERSGFDVAPETAAHSGDLESAVS